MDFDEYMALGTADKRILQEEWRGLERAIREAAKLLKCEPTAEAVAKAYRKMWDDTERMKSELKRLEE